MTVLTFMFFWFINNFGFISILLQNVGGGDADIPPPPPGAGSAVNGYDAHQCQRCRAFDGSQLDRANSSESGPGEGCTYWAHTKCLGIRYKKSKQNLLKKWADNYFRCPQHF